MQVNFPGSRGAGGFGSETAAKFAAFALQQGTHRGSSAMPTKLRLALHRSDIVSAEGLDKLQPCVVASLAGLGVQHGRPQGL